MGLIGLLLGLNRDVLLSFLGLRIPTFIGEVLDIIIMALVLGYVFMMFFNVPRKDYDPLTNVGFDWYGFKIAIVVIAPAIILHELAHKFVAIGFGISATFYAAYGFLLLAILLRYFRFPFLFFVPGYVAYTPIEAIAPSLLVPVAGPLVHLFFFIGCLVLIKNVKFGKMIFKTKYNNVLPILHLIKYVNLFLFVLNMLPIPGFDGGYFFFTLFRLIF
ncbi:hypothetical protein DRJ17_04425 [Candidatus Woesearchaeota archaeon]|nr:MAG: hypothetical protein DRJ17_04425 [Candidatus Woesearchaeota archaeon]